MTTGLPTDFLKKTPADEADSSSLFPPKPDNLDRCCRLAMALSEVSGSPSSDLIVGRQ